jgi:hypothetical protein
VNEDFNRNEKSRATGYMGKNPEVAWMQVLDSQATDRRNDKIPTNTTLQCQVPIDGSISSMNYHLDYYSIPDPGVPNAFIIPPKALADRLLQIYLEKVHVSLPLIRQDLFLEQYRRCYSGGEQNPGSKWLSVFNMVCAIGCAFCRLSGLDIPEKADGNLFAARASSLGLSGKALCDRNDLQQVQAEALLAFFFLIQSQINRYDFSKGYIICKRLLTTLRVMENDWRCRSFGHRARAQSTDKYQWARCELKRS